jgi:hypothetical protein
MVPGTTSTSLSDEFDVTGASCLSDAMMTAKWFEMRLVRFATARALMPTYQLAIFKFSVASNDARTWFEQLKPPQRHDYTPPGAIVGSHWSVWRMASDARFDEF